MRPISAIPFVIVAVVIGVVLWLLFRAPDSMDRDLGRTKPVGSPHGSEVGATPADATNSSPTSDADSPADEEPESPIDAGPPLLAGRVVGEGSGIAGANVYLFAVREVEALIERLERIVPTGGDLPDIPKLVADLRSELSRFRASGLHVTSDENGDFELRGDHVGGFTVLVYARGWLFDYGNVVSLDPARTAELTVALEKGA
ncbi:MAG: hypothetical protein KDC38_18660, partial [Planctomycetes bacterium]|nr:hypothetical protein [Planctomycetota bacterium]